MRPNGIRDESEALLSCGTAIGSSPRTISSYAFSGVWMQTLYSRYPLLPTNQNSKGFWATAFPVLVQKQLPPGSHTVITGEREGGGFARARVDDKPGLPFIPRARPCVTFPQPKNKCSFLIGLTSLLIHGTP